MKRLFKNSNPFLLLLIPVFFALVLGVCYQVHLKTDLFSGTEQATSLFSKSLTLVKMVCSVAKEKLW